MQACTGTTAISLDHVCANRSGYCRRYRREGWDSRPPGVPKPPIGEMVADTLRLLVR